MISGNWRARGQAAMDKECVKGKEREVNVVSLFKARKKAGGAA